MQKTPKKQLDYLIIGQGLAGSILSYKLLKMGKKITVINQFDPKSSSYIAGGIFSPIAGQRIAKIWQADAIFPQMADFYRELERELDCSFFHQLPYIKLLINDDLKKFAQRRFDDPEYAQYIKRIRFGQNKHDAIEIQHTGWVDTTKFLDTYRTLLKQQNSYIEDWFDVDQLRVDQLKISENEIKYKDITAKQLIFANGLQATQNRFFDHHRFIPTKGELLTVKMPLLRTRLRRALQPLINEVNITDFERRRLATYDSVILSGNVFILPIGDDLFHVGATFARVFDDSLPTQKAKQWLCTELEKLIDTPYEIVDHKVGVRPTTPGHRPIVEWHEQYPNIGIFTGFGAKGVSYIPHCAELLLD